MNAVDLRGVTPLHLALSRLRVIGGSEGEDSPEGIPLTRKKEITQVVVCSMCYFSPAHKVLVCEHWMVVSQVSQLMLSWSYTTLAFVACNIENLVCEYLI